MEFSRPNNPKSSAQPIEVEGVSVSAINSNTILVSAKELNPLSQSLVDGIKSAAEAAGTAKIILDLSGVERLPKDLRETIFALWGEKKLAGIVGKEMLEGQPKEALKPLTNFSDLKTVRSVDALLDQSGITRGSIAEQASTLDGLRKDLAARLNADQVGSFSGAAFRSSFREEVQDSRPAVKVSEFSSGALKIECIHSSLMDETKAMKDFCDTIVEASLRSRGNVHLDLSRADYLQSSAFGAILAADRFLDERGKRLIVENPSDKVMQTLCRMRVDSLLEIEAA